jgi:signal transduction histidine kinase
MTAETRSTVGARHSPYRQRVVAWWHWLAPRPLDQISIVLYPVGLLYYIGTHLPSVCGCAFPSTSIIMMAVAFSLLLLLDRWEYQRYGATTPRRVVFALLVCRTLLIMLGLQFETSTFPDFFSLMVPFTAALTIGASAGWISGAIVWLLLMVRLDVLQPGWDNNTLLVTDMITYSLGIVFVVMMGRLVYQEQASRLRAEQLLRELEHSHRQLYAYAGKVAELAAVDERNRLARDMHDSLGHFLTVINVQLEKAQAFRQTNGAVAERAVDDAKRLAHEALDDVRRSVGVLRASNAPFALIPALHELAARVQSARLQVTVTTDVEERVIPPLARLALYRVAQEALTNVQRHARATTVQIQLCSNAQGVQLSIADDGVGFVAEQLQQMPQGGGYGLQGIQERLTVIGGSVAIQSAPGHGTVISAYVPCQSATE